jgi:hypothetical protein
VLQNVFFYSVITSELTEDYNLLQYKNFFEKFNQLPDCSKVILLQLKIYKLILRPGSK